MKRKDFIASAAALIFTPAFVSVFLTACKKEEEPEPKKATGVDFTIDLSSSHYSSLAQKGNFVYKDNIIIVHRSDDSYIALSSICTHQNCTVGFDSSTGKLPCPCHGSVFNPDGSVVNGPASAALTRYNTSLSGNSLRVFS